MGNNYGTNKNDSDEENDTHIKTITDDTNNQNLSLEERKIIAEKRLLYLQKQKNQNNIVSKKRKHIAKIDEDKKHDSYIRDLLN